ncbi:MAG: metal-dependent hydrolase [Patescibacteria group bacterium]|nr:metal-dependent hydrolase [Patescibacteria group bacterium]
MLPLGHIATGYLVGRIVSFYANAPSEYADLFVFGGIIAGTIPDIDFIPFFIKHRALKLVRGSSHRNYITHTPVLWFILGLCIYFLNYDSPVRYFGIILWLGTWSHFLGDSLEYGIRWLWPFTNTYYSVYPNPSAPKLSEIAASIHSPEGSIPFYFEYLRVVYFKSRVCWLECSVIIIALFFFFYI